MFFRSRHIIILSLLVLSFLAGCETNRGQLIPYVRVDIYLDLYSQLGTLGPGESMLLAGGVNGIILYRDTENGFFAYDRTCTLFPEHDEAVAEDPDFIGVFACPECESSFLVMNGAEPIEGPAAYPLVQYSTSITGNLLHIYN